MANQGMDDSGDRLLKKIEPVIKSNGTFENPFGSWQGMPTRGNMCRFMRERMVTNWRGTDKIPNKVSTVLLSNHTGRAASPSYYS